jgi:hypothetical protein
MRHETSREWILLAVFGELGERLRSSTHTFGVRRLPGRAESVESFAALAGEE